MTPAAELVLESDGRWGHDVRRLRERFPIPWQVRVYMVAGRTAIASAYMAPDEGNASIRLEAGIERDTPTQAVERLIAAADSFGVRGEQIIDLSGAKAAMAEKIAGRRIPRARGPRRPRRNGAGS